MTSNETFWKKMKICKGMRADGKDGECVDPDRHNHGCQSCPIEGGLYEPEPIIITQKDSDRE